MLIDDLDLRILRQLQFASDLSVAELAEALGIGQGLCARRLDRLRDDKIILGQHAIINWAALGYTVEVSLRVTLDKTDPRAFDVFMSEARAVPEVLELQTFLGRVDFRLHVIARDLADYQRLYRDRILTLPHIAEIEALMQVGAIKERGALPI